MDSIHGYRTVRVQKRKGSLGFSIKGGSEHGIPVVVSEIERIGRSEIHLGDELISVNGTNLQGVSHEDAVQKLRNSKGPVVILRVRSNRILEDTFSTPNKKESTESLLPLSYKSISDWWTVPDENLHSLPQGWSRRIDHKTGKPYFENHFTQTSTWTDPRTLIPVPLKEFDWRGLAPGWERFIDGFGDVYYVNHDTQTTHWDSPRGLREQKLLKVLRQFLEEEKSKLNQMQDELKEKRTILLSKNQHFEAKEILSSKENTKENGGDESENANETDILDDIMVLNEEIDELDSQVTITHQQLKKLTDIFHKAQSEDIGDIDSFESSKLLSTELQDKFISFKSMESKFHSSLQNLEQIRKSKGLGDTPITYMLQMTPVKDKKMFGKDDDKDEQWIHVLADKLTGKTNCEMRVELCILDVCLSHAHQLTQRSEEVCQWVNETRGFNWDKVIDELIVLDLSVFNDEWMNTENFRYKLEKITSSI